MNVLKLSKMCRVCLKDMNFNTDMQSVLDEVISSKLKLCGGINIERKINGEYPNLICENCCRNLEVAYNFRITCENSEKALKEIILDIQCTKDLNKFQIFDEQNPSSLGRMSPDSKYLNVNFKTEPINNIQELDSLEKDIFQQDDDYAEYKIEMLNEDEENTKNIDEIETENIIRKYVKKNSLKIESSANIRNKRKYTKKTITPKLSNEETKYVCEYCNVEYKGKSSFTYHVRRHTNELNYVCEICGTAFETNFKLKRHFFKHMGTLPYSCRSCDMKFASSSNRDRHERRLHTTIRPFQCAYCDKAFSYSDQLKNHVRVHTGEKPYVCEKCGSAFKRKSHLSAHSNALTPCVIKMTLKNKMNGEKLKIQKLSGKNSKTNLKSKKKITNCVENENYDIINEEIEGDSITCLASEKLPTEYIHQEECSSLNIGTKAISNKCAIVNSFENGDNLFLS